MTDHIESIQGMASHVR